MLSVSALYVYPIKSCRAIDLKAVRFDAGGPTYDRRFMVVDENGRFLTQRELPRFALIEAKLGPMSIGVSAPGMPALKVAMTQRDPKRIPVQIWEDRGEAEDTGENAASWFSQFLQRECRLVRVPEDGLRPVDPRYARAPAEVGFADAYPVLLTSEASLTDLNGRLAQNVPMSRFRPNIVVRGGDAYAEDSWKQIRIGELVLDVVKPCSRCVTINVDQLNAQQSKEPLATLATYRTRDNKVYFGQNCVHLGYGSIRVGDSVEVLETA